MPHKATLAGLFILIAAALPVHAQGTVQPTVTVVPFQITHSETPDAGAEIADDLANQLVESGQYRVLDRAWLPITKRGAGLPPVILRGAAESQRSDDRRMPSRNPNHRCEERRVDPADVGDERRERARRYQEYDGWDVETRADACGGNGLITCD